VEASELAPGSVPVRQEELPTTLGLERVQHWAPGPASTDPGEASVLSEDIHQSFRAALLSLLFDPFACQQFALRG